MVNRKSRGASNGDRQSPYYSYRTLRVAFMAHSQHRGGVGLTRLDEVYYPLLGGLDESIERQFRLRMSLRWG